MPTPLELAGVIISLVVLVVILITAVPKFIKHFFTPRLDLSLFTYAKERATQKGVFQGNTQVRFDRELRVLPNSDIQLAFSLRPIWSYHVTTVEIHGGGKSRITRENIFADKQRFWQEKEYTDMDGAYKFSPEIILRKKHISDPTIIDVGVEPKFNKGEERTITVRISTKESSKLFTKHFTLIGSEKAPDVG